MPRSTAHTTCGYCCAVSPNGQCSDTIVSRAVARLGVRGEAVGGERVGHRGERGAHRAVALGGVHARRRASVPYSKPDLVGQRLGLLGPERVERPGEQRAEQVVVLGGEREGGVERAGEVALRRTPGGPGRYRRRTPCHLDDEVAAAGELLEVVAGDVGVELERSATAPAVTPAAPGVAGEEVDVPPGGVAERVGDRAHHRAELVRGEGLGGPWPVFYLRP